MKMYRGFRDGWLDLMSFTPCLKFDSIQFNS